LRTPKYQVENEKSNAEYLTPKNDNQKSAFTILDKPKRRITMFINLNRVRSFAKAAGISAMSLGVILCSSVPSYAGTFKQNHPRRAEVLGRDNNQNRQLNRNFGNLGGHYGQLKSEDAGIRRQEQRDARINGGYITKGQQAQLNREENHVERQIQRDK
jgi:hypothetical protein